MAASLNVVEQNKKDAKRKYPKCVPAAKLRNAKGKSNPQFQGKSRGNVGPKPTNVKTIVRKI